MILDNLIAPMLLLCACVYRVACHYNHPIEVQLWDARKTPLDYMVDVTNQFGLKLLYEHNFLNQNNVAFSPYGLTGILVALFEGVDGDSSYQIQRSMELPWNRDVMRIGFRDIHRTLKTYFIPEEGFLAGLALNNENVTFKEAYRNILRFYGFDLERDRFLKPSNNPTTIAEAPEPTTDSNREETTMTSGGAGTSSLEPRETTPLAATTASSLMQSVATPQTTTSANAAATTVVATAAVLEASRDPTSDSTLDAVRTSSEPPRDSTVTTVQTSSEPPSESTSATVQTSTEPPNDSAAAAVETTTARPTVLTSAVEASSEAPSEMPSTLGDSTSENITTNSQMSSISMPPAMIPESSTTIISVAEAITSPVAPTTTTTPMTAIGDGDVELIPSVATGSLAPPPPTAETSATTIASADPTSKAVSPAGEVTTEAALETAEPPASTPSESSAPTSTTRETTTAASSLETLQRRKKSILDFIMERSPLYEEYLYERPLDFATAIDSKFSDEKMFLANGLRNVEVSYMVYDTVLEYTYLPHFKASAIRLPLDNDHYYLLVVLPDYEFELNRLTKRLAQESNLRDIYSALQPRHVHACVPSFMVKGFVTLTTDLQRLGIRDVFEPRQSDFSPMTVQKGVYVRNVEQAITVTIRKYETKTPQKSRYVLNRHPVQFSATYPFLYFVMDSSIHVSLMAGKVMDPLNTRVI